MMDHAMYLQGIEHCAEVLPETLREWRTFDDVLQDEYMEQINWFLDNFEEQSAGFTGQHALRLTLARTKIIEALADWVRGRYV